jgi:hypothetical protein
MTRSTASDPKVDLHFWNPSDAYSYSGASFGADPAGRASARTPKAARDGQRRAALVFRDFVRQLEELDAKPSKTARGAPR